jgi:hypothetical protein
LEWNGYSYGMIIFLFGKGLFLEVVIPIGIHIPWGKGNIFQKKSFILYIYKSQTLHWLSGQPIYGVGGGRTTPGTLRGGPPRHYGGGVTTLCAFGGGTSHPRLAFGVAELASGVAAVPRGWQATPDEYFGGGPICFGGGPGDHFEGGYDLPLLLGGSRPPQWLVGPHRFFFFFFS